MAKKRKAIDWELAESHYRAGILSIRGIAKECGCSDAGVRKKAREEGWVRDLTAKVKRSCDDKVRKKTLLTLGVLSGVRADGVDSNPREKEIIEASAEMLSDIVISHRTDIVQKRGLVAKLFAEIEAITDSPELIDQIREAVNGDDDAVKVIDRMRSIPMRVDATIKLVSAYQKLIAMERQAFGLDDDNSRKNDDISTMSREELEAIARG